MNIIYERLPIYVIGVDEKTWEQLKTWDLKLLGVDKVLVQEDLYILEFKENSERESFEMCMLMNHIEVEEFELDEYTELKLRS